MSTLNDLLSTPLGVDETALAAENFVKIAAARGMDVNSMTEEQILGSFNKMAEEVAKEEAAEELADKLQEASTAADEQGAADEGGEDDEEKEAAVAEAIKLGEIAGLSHINVLEKYATEGDDEGDESEDDDEPEPEELKEAALTLLVAADEQEKTAEDYGLLEKIASAGETEKLKEAAIELWDVAEEMEKSGASPVGFTQRFSTPAKKAVEKVIEKVVRHAPSAERAARFSGPGRWQGPVQQIIGGGATPLAEKGGRSWARTIGSLLRGAKGKAGLTRASALSGMSAGEIAGLSAALAGTAGGAGYGGYRGVKALTKKSSAEDILQALMTKEAIGAPVISSAAGRNWSKTLGGLLRGVKSSGGQARKDILKGMSAGEIAGLAAALAGTAGAAGGAGYGGYRGVKALTKKSSAEAELLEKIGEYMDGGAGEASWDDQVAARALEKLGERGLL